jgi:hypothetical protein
MAAAAPAPAPATQPGTQPTTKPSIDVVAISERRGATLAAQPDSAERAPGLSVYLRVAGVDRPASYGEVVVTKATDDAATNLSPPPRAAGEQKTQEFTSVKQVTGAPDAEAAPGAFVARVDLGSPARAAKRIAVLKGELRLTLGGDDKTLTLPGVLSLRGKTVEHPDLTRAGITVQVGAPGRLGGDELPVMVSGDGAQSVQVGVVDAGGNSITGSGSGSRSAGSESWTWHLSRPLQPTDALTITLPAGQKFVTVPFELKDIELP